MRRIPACSWPVALLRAMRSVPFLFGVFVERARQERKWGPQSHPSFGRDGPLPEALVQAAKDACETDFDVGDPNWCSVLHEECMEAQGEADPAKLRAELVQTAAVAAAWHECV